MKKHKIHIYYTTIKTNKEWPDVRFYYISRHFGVPFMKFNLPSDIDNERHQVAEHFGLGYSKLSFTPRLKHSDIPQIVLDRMA